MTRLSDLPRPRRLAFLASMERLGAAVEEACTELDPAYRLGPQHDELRAAITRRLLTTNTG